MTATATETTPALTQAQEESIGAFAGRVLARMAESLQMLLGQKVTLEAGSASVEDSAGIRLLLPSSCAAMSIRLDPALTESVLGIVELPLARTFAHFGRMSPPEEVASAREAGPPLETEDQEEVRTVAGFFAAAIGQEWDGNEADSKDGSGDDSTSVLVLNESAWEGGEDPLSDGAWISVETTCKIGKGEVDPLRLLLPWSLASRMIKSLEPETGGDSPATTAEAPAAAATSSDAPIQRARRAAPTQALAPVVCVGDEALAPALSQALENREVLSLADSSALVSLLTTSSPELVIVRIADGDEAAIRGLARLKHEHDTMRGHPVVVLLENPVKSTVLLCGRLGLVNVLPASVGVDVIARRIRPTLNRHH
ncbi:MAG: hypothetical protein CMJ83_11100 [Planctomycetes bacterium]|nr:hypothetical protein [Planctomycetota bacterium]